MLEYETQIRIIFFFTVLVIMALGETVIARRQLSVSKPGRWFNNLGIILLSSILVKLTFPVTAMEIYRRKSDRGQQGKPAA
ncbi:MAG: hypothetical protein L3J57_12130 [Desulfuromusa sp.]|nr:hypothetical protein [Desulfuromusa sp.]